jgi:hypothetical protein
MYVITQTDVLSVSERKDRRLNSTLGQNGSFTTHARARNDSPLQSKDEFCESWAQNCITFSGGQRPMLKVEGQGGSARVPALL